LLSDRTQLDVFEAVFDEVFRGLSDEAFRGDPLAEPPPARRQADRGREIPGAPNRSSSGRPGSGTAAGAADPGDGMSMPLGLADETERLGSKDFAACTDDELLVLVRLMEQLPAALPRRASRRTRRSRHGAELDVRATLRAAHRTAGDPVRQIRRRRQDRPRRVVLLADVSGSMEPYARAYLHLLHGAVRAARAEAFVFATRLTRITVALRATAPELALHRAATRAPDWSGGTRLGEAIAAFNDTWGRRGMARGAVVVIVSDGWDAGPPERLGEQMARLSRLAHRIVWVNPRLQSARYQPLVGGMQAALPHVDAFVGGYSLDSMNEVLAALSGR
jgi:uncharacterized protein with von Willebrand factor type A (vWA) domain